MDLNVFGGFIATILIFYTLPIFVIVNLFKLALLT